MEPPTNRLTNAPIVLAAGVICLSLWVAASHSPSGGAVFLLGSAAVYALIFAALAAVGWKLGRMPVAVVAVFLGVVVFARPLPAPAPVAEAQHPSAEEVQGPLPPTSTASNLTDITRMRATDAELDAAARDYYGRSTDAVVQRKIDAIRGVAPTGRKPGE